MSKMSKIISMNEVKQHNYSDKNLWIVINDDVYDVTTYLEEHPGGEDPLIGVAGSDGTEEFNDAGHSKDAKKLMIKYKIGTLPTEERKIAPVEPSQSIHAKRSGCKTPPTPRPEGRVKAIVVPRERRPRGQPCEGRLKWAVVALATAILIGFAIRKYAAT